MSRPDATNLTWHGSSVTALDRYRLLGQKGAVVWLTGLSAAGKSTIAVLLEQKLIEEGRLAYRLDGDNIRHGLCSNLGFSAEDRVENIRRVGEVAKLFADAGVITLASFISPFRADRQLMREKVLPRSFIEVYVKVSLEAAERRDPKGLYRKARAGLLKQFTGIDDPYEPPEQPEITLDTEQLEPAESARMLFDYLKRERFLEP